MTYYVPLMMNLENRRCVIVGGGSVAERKMVSLIDAGARLVLISPTATSLLERWDAEDRLTWERRRYREGDLQGAFLVYAATDQAEVNDAVTAEANALGIPVNHAGEGGKGSFISPSVVRRGGLVLGVSTSGAGPLAAKKLSRDLETHFGEDYETYVVFLSLARKMIKERVADTQRRAVLFKALVEMDILASIREGRFPAWNEDKWIAWMDEYREE
ncbi:MULTISPECIES: precorrin-2 dehydrogenase/sirohydrochlorin ferrochelatase family protein [Paenibacillus]|uniref:precorrin-2 dehydrogenase/sirohydrochlorin ferrochelatase family protein n=1 Tax=Paenibacillus TaxID=44249 RepID=UPI002FE18089